MTRRLPLGIDIGATRLRIVAMRAERSGVTRLDSFSTRDFEESTERVSASTVSSVMSEAIAELGGRWRTCVLALPWHSAAIKCLEFPPMRTSERTRAARIEARRFIPWNEGTSLRVRLQCVDGDNAHLVVVSPIVAIRERVKAASDVRLRVVALDYEPFALLRAFPQADAVLDVGFRQSRLYGRLSRSFRVASFEAGGATLTARIAAALSVDCEEAEVLKRTTNTDGFCTDERADFVRRTREAIDALRERETVRTIGVAGNGSRVAGFLERLTASAGVSSNSCKHIADDAGGLGVSLAPDLALAASLASWAVD